MKITPIVVHNGECDCSMQYADNEQDAHDWTCRGWFFQRLGTHEDNGILKVPAVRIQYSFRDVVKIAVI